MPRKNENVDASVEDLPAHGEREPGKTTRKRTPADSPSPDDPDLVTGSAAESISREAVERRAYELYEQRGRQEGQHDDDWLRAERELREGDRR